MALSTRNSSDDNTSHKERNCVDRLALLEVQHQTDDENDLREQEDMSSFSSTNVKLVDMSHDGKGYGLVATRFILKGEIIFTEIPKSFLSIQKPRSGVITSTYNNLLACQNCFCSLEPCTIMKLPMKHFWPIPEYDGIFQKLLEEEEQEEVQNIEPESEEEKNQFCVDKHGRVICKLCRSLFCSMTCKDTFNNNGSLDKKKKPHYFCCCLFKKAKNALIETFVNEYNTTFFQNWSIILATRIFCSILIELRNNNNANANNNNKSVDDTKNSDNNNNTMVIHDRFLLYKYFCGDSSDISNLKVGVPFQMNDDDDDEGEETKNGIDTTPISKKYTIKPYYDILCDLLSVTSDEKNQKFVSSSSFNDNKNNHNKDDGSLLLSLEFFGRLTSICKRNGVGLNTKSPLACYEDDLSNECLSDDNCNNKQKEIKQKLGIALMEHAMNNKYTANNFDFDEFFKVQTISLLPTFARINHSCMPNATIVDDEYLSSKIDMVALDDIDRNEEITTTYLNESDMKLNTNGRRHILLSKYLFTCNCRRCLQNG